MQAAVGPGGKDSYVRDKTHNITVVWAGRGMDGGVSATMDDYDGGAGDNSADL